MDSSTVSTSRRLTPRVLLSSIAALASLLVVPACGTDASPPERVARSVHSLANACFAISSGTSGKYLVPDRAGTGFKLKDVSLARASRFHFRAADLGIFLFRDVDGAYASAEETGLGRSTDLLSDTLLNDDTYVSPAEWELTISPNDATLFRARNRATGQYIASSGLTGDESRAMDLVLTETTGCSAFPELATNATGAVTRTHYDDGAVFGFVDAHSHLFTNFGFGGGGTFHGAPFHRLGVEHALPDCDISHGWEGRRDLLGFFYGGGTLDLTLGAVALIRGEIQTFNHFSEGYPEFTDWPNARKSYTHQTQYYKWVERSYLGGLRLLVQHATSNQVLCDLVTGAHAQDPRFTCNEMFSAERSIDETLALERYVDAQSGGPGLGWFRVVHTPAEARQVIGEGKLAVILGIETSNLFDCFLVPRPGFPTCDEAYVKERLDYFHARGVRVLFPVHKFDNAFSAGDGNRNFIELGGFLNSGHYSNFTTDCDPNVPAPFDHGPVHFGGFNAPRAEYASAPPVDVSGFADSPLKTLLPHLDALAVPPIPGEHCQNAGLTPLGETMIFEMMKRGMIIEIDHLPQRSYTRAVEMLVDNDYPGAGTHGSSAHGVLYSLGGISAMGLPRCGNPNNPEEAALGVRARIAEIVAAGGYPAQGFAFDFNGLAGAPGPRFGPDSGCSGAQSNPITYPFTSYAGDVQFEAPMLGNRSVDFNEEGMIHIGLIPELIEDARHLGVTDADLEPIFRSAEGYIRMWERAETRGEAIRTGAP
jgi:microsomal dipeptidase-like Zn-dependent dipeptidase